MALYLHVAPTLVAHRAWSAFPELEPRIPIPASYVDQCAVFSFADCVKHHYQSSMEERGEAEYLRYLIMTREGEAPSFGGTSYIRDNSGHQATALTNGPSLTTRRTGQTGTASASDTPDPALDVEAVYEDD